MKIVFDIEKAMHNALTCILFVSVFLLFDCVCIGQSNEVLRELKEKMTNTGVISFDHDGERRDSVNHFAERTSGFLRYDGTNSHRFNRFFSLKNQEFILDRTIEFLFCPNEANYRIQTKNQHEVKVFSTLKIPGTIDLSKSLGNFQVLFGWLYIDQEKPVFLPDIIQILKPETIEFQQNADGIFVLTGKNDSIEMEMRLAPEADNAISLFSFTRLPPSRQPNLYDFYRYQVESFQNLNGFFFPKKYVVEYKREGGKVEIAGEQRIAPGANSRSVYSLKNIKRKEKASIAPKDIVSKIPDGTEVYMDEVPPIRYVWLDGKIVPWTDELALALARGHGRGFIPGVGSPRFWLMAIGVIMIAVALGVKTREYFKKRRGAE